eukprot:Partr_v1_DN26829_c0_g1_i2_m40547 putative decarboxylase
MMEYQYRAYKPQPLLNCESKKKMTADSHRQVTCIAPVNIAVIKYWGKRDVDLILPTNSSLSVTLDTRDLHSKTTIRASPDFPRDRFWLNGDEVPLTSKRMITVISSLRKRRELLEEQGIVQVGVSDWKVHICSENNFPTAAGLASSASGFACLVYALARLYELVEDRSPLVGAVEEISKYARLGSGSACRSVFGGFVKWEMGSLADGSDSRAVQVAARSHWPQMRAMILVVDDGRKDVSSTSGMQSTVETSKLFQWRVQSCVLERMRAMEQAVRSRNFDLFARVTMEDSNQFHAVCLDTYPPIFYMNDTSRLIVQFVHALNAAMGRLVVAYTFDAGPNAVLYHEEKDAATVVKALRLFLKADEKLVESLPPIDDAEHMLILETVAQKYATVPGAIKRIISTGVGDGPSTLTKAGDSLLDNTGMPKHLNQ